MRYRVVQHGERRYLIVQGRWEAKLLKVMEQFHLTQLEFQDFSREGPVRIDFLRDLPFLERLSRWAFGVRDISPLYDLRALSELSVSECNCTIDFPRLPSLRRLRLGWSAKRFASLLDCTALQSLGLDYYTGPDFGAFANLKGLEHIGFGFTRIEHFAGLGAFVNLHRLSLGPVNRLQSLKNVETCPTLREIEIEAAKNLRSIDGVQHLPALQILSFIRCPNIMSIKPITAHPALERVGIGQTSNVRDGDLSPLATLPRLKLASFMDANTTIDKMRRFRSCSRLSGISSLRCWIATNRQVRKHSRTAVRKELGLMEVVFNEYRQRCNAAEAFEALLTDRRTSTRFQDAST